MGEILGFGITHYPGLSFQGNMTRRIKLSLADPALPERLRSARLLLYGSEIEGQSYQS